MVNNCAPANAIKAVFQFSYEFRLRLSHGLAISIANDY